MGFDEIPRYVPFNYGKSYIGALALVGINIEGVLDPVMENLSYVSKYHTIYNYGGSYIGELYYNFGYAAYLFAPLMGILLTRISNKFSFFLQKKYYLSASLYIMFFYGFLLWVRGYANAMTRGCMWGTLLLMFAYTINNKGGKKWSQ